MFFKAYTARFISTRARHRQYVNFQKEDFIMYSMEQVVNLAKHRGFVFLVLKFTVVLQTLGITVHLESN